MPHRCRPPRNTGASRGAETPGPPEPRRGGGYCRTEKTRAPAVPETETASRAGRDRTRSRVTDPSPAWRSGRWWRAWYWKVRSWSLQLARACKVPLSGARRAVPQPWRQHGRAADIVQRCGMVTGIGARMTTVAFRGLYLAELNDLYDAEQPVPFQLPP